MRQEDRTNLLLNIEKMVFFLFVTGLGLGILVGLPRVMVPLALAFIFVLVLNPVIPYFNKIGINRNISIVLLLFLLCSLLVYPIIKLIPLIKEESENFRFYIPKLEMFLGQYYQLAKGWIKAKTGFEIGDKLLQDTLTYIQYESSNILMRLPKLMASFFEWLFLTPLFLFFMLKDGSAFKFSFLRIVPNPIFEQTYYLFYKFNKQLGDFIFAKFIEASIVCVIVTAGLLFLQVRFAIILGGIAGITNIVPYVGPVLGVIPALIVGLIEYGLGAQLGGIVTLYLVANVVDNAFIFPVLVSKIVDLHPMIVVISVILGSQYMGIVGMVVSVPLAAIVKLIVVEIHKELNPSFYKSNI